MPLHGTLQPPKSPVALAPVVHRCLLAVVACRAVQPPSTRIVWLLPSVRVHLFGCQCLLRLGTGCRVRWPLMFFCYTPTPTLRLHVSCPSMGCGGPAMAETEPGLAGVPFLLLARGGFHPEAAKTGGCSAQSAGSALSLLSLIFCALSLHLHSIPAGGGFAGKGGGKVGEGGGGEGGAGGRCPACQRDQREAIGGQARAQGCPCPHHLPDPDAQEEPPLAPTLSVGFP